MAILTGETDSGGYSVEKGKRNVLENNSQCGLDQILVTGWKGMKTERWIG